MNTARIGFVLALSFMSAQVPPAASQVARVPTSNRPRPAQLLGTISVIPAKGLIEGNLCLVGDSIRGVSSFKLHHGLNVRQVRDAATNQLLDFDRSEGENSSEAISYTLSKPANATGLCVEYVGAYPVYNLDSGERATSDWKGDIRFDGRTVRATEQTRFYPVPVDAVTGAETNALAYDLKVSCAGCSGIYVNGSAPASGPVATFRSSTPRPLFLYAGNFPFSAINSVYFVGAEVSEADAAIITGSIQKIASAHADYLQVPYADEPAFLTFAAVSRTRKIGETSWMFVTWPTIAMDGRVSFDSLLSGVGPERALKQGSPRLVAHEMAHYYFLTRFDPRGPLRWFLLESTAEFLAMKYLRTSEGEQAFRKLAEAYKSRVLKGGEFIPLNAITDAEQVSSDYRYMLGPLLLFALEKHVGVPVVRKTLSELVRKPPADDIDFAALVKRLKAAGATEKQLSGFAAQCLLPQLEPACLTL